MLLRCNLVFEREKKVFDTQFAIVSKMCFSNYYCFSNYWTNYEHSKRRATVQDFQEFMPLVVQMYRSENWFSLHNIDYPNGIVDSN